MGILIFFVAVISGGFLGLLLWSLSEVPLVLREIALNSRKTANSGSNYTLMIVLHILIKIGAILLWIIFFLLALAAFFRSDSLKDIFKF